MVIVTIYRRKMHGLSTIGAILPYDHICTQQEQSTMRNLRFKDSRHANNPLKHIFPANAECICNLQFTWSSDVSFCADVLDYLVGICSSNLMYTLHKEESIPVVSKLSLECKCTGVVPQSALFKLQ